MPDSINAIGPKTTPDTLERRGKINGGFSRELPEEFADLVGVTGQNIASKKNARRENDFQALFDLLQEEKLTQNVPEGTINKQTFSQLYPHLRTTTG